KAMRSGAADPPPDVPAQAAAGSMASNSGSAIAVPSPFSAVRREMCHLLVMVRLLVVSVVAPPLERVALDDCQDERGESIVCFDHLLDDAVDRAAVIVLQS